jgi:hypothetical protein
LRNLSISCSIFVVAICDVLEKHDVSIFRVEDEDILFLINVCIYPRTHRASKHTISTFSSFPPSEPEISPEFYTFTNCVSLPPQIQIVAGWIFSNVALLGSLNGIYSFYQDGADKTVSESALYNGLFRNFWAFGVGVTIFMCVTGYGGNVPYLYEI